MCRGVVLEAISLGDHVELAVVVDLSKGPGRCLSEEASEDLGHELCE